MMFESERIGLHGVFPLHDDHIRARIHGVEPIPEVEATTDNHGKTLQAVLYGAPRWTDVDLAALAARKGHDQALLAGYRHYGPEVLSHLQGTFAVIVVDEAGRRLLLATDRLGIRPLYYGQVGGILVFGERADVVATHPAINAGISPQGLYNYLYFHVVPGPGTIFEGVTRLLPGQALHVSEGSVRVLPYWEPRYGSSAAGEPEAQLRTRFRDLVRQAVRDAADSAGGSVGAFLSGGTDSSTVAGMLSQILPGRARTYSIGFDASGYDEMEYAHIAARHFGTEHHEYYVTPQDVTDAVPQIATRMDQPFGNASVVPAYYCARMAREDGVGCLLAGDGGDELFGGNYRYAKQQIFEYYRRVPSPLRRGVVEPLLLDVPGMASLPGVSKLRNYVAQARIPMPERMEGYNLLRRLGAERILTEAWLAQTDPDQPLRWLHECYHGVAATSMVDRMLAVDMRFTLADSDLPKVNAACGLAGVMVRYPWLDDRLVAFAATLPPEQKVRGTQLRYLFKQALRGFLPDEIIAKRKQGFGLPFGVWLRDHQGLRNLAGDSLQSLAGRGLLRRDAVDDLLGGRHQEHAAYYGTFIWILMMLEQWLAGRDTEGAWT